MREIRRVLKDDGVLIAPTFTHAGNSFSGKVRAFFMKLAGFPLHSKWTSEEYLTFSAAERLDGAEKRCSESVISVNLYRMCEIGGVICHFLKIPAIPWGLAEKSWLP